MTPEQVEHRRAIGRAYYARNREAVKKRKLVAYYANRGVRLEQMNAWKEKNADSRRSYDSDWVADNTPRKYALNAAYRERNRVTTILRSAKTRATAKGLEFTIGPDDISIPDTCPYLGIPLTKTLGGGRSDGSPSLDRIDSTKGYVPGNVEVISHRANTVKSFGSAAEHRIIAERMESLQS